MMLAFSIASFLRAGAPRIAVTPCLLSHRAPVYIAKMQ